MWRLYIQAFSVELMDSPDAIDVPQSQGLADPELTAGHWSFHL